MIVRGNEIVQRCQIDHLTMLYLIRSFRVNWPDLVVDRGERTDTSYEFFIYRDQTHRIDWDSYGATQENDDSMIYVLLDYEHNSVGLVAAEGDSETARMAREALGKLPLRLAQ